MNLLVPKFYGVVLAIFRLLPHSQWRWLSMRRRSLTFCSRKWLPDRIYWNCKFCIASCLCQWPYHRSTCSNQHISSIAGFAMARQCLAVKLCVSIGDIPIALSTPRLDVLLLESRCCRSGEPLRATPCSYLLFRQKEG